MIGWVDFFIFINFAIERIFCFAIEMAELTSMLDVWRGVLEQNGFRISRTKTKYMEFNFGESRGENSDLGLGNDAVPKKERFKYLESYLQSDGRIDRYVQHRIQMGWQKWKGASGVLCDQKVPLKLKGKIYKIVIRQTLLY